MVKNVTGGNKQKGQARKNITIRTTSRPTRFAKEEEELYGQVQKMLGDGQCHVLCSDGRLRLCHIRGKFRGRGKRDNLVTTSTFVLVGIRDYESKREIGDKKLENCDLMEVYNDSEKEIIHKREKVIDWKIFSSIDETFKEADESVVDFTENTVHNDYESLMKEDILEISIETNDVVNIDDI